MQHDKTEYFNSAPNPRISQIYERKLLLVVLSLFVFTVCSFMCVCLCRSKPLVQLGLKAEGLGQSPAELPTPSQQMSAANTLPHTYTHTCWHGQGIHAVPPQLIEII